ncbi:hypothetical protein ANME2D_00220 [Candidatus Methanoperedens nitroreducens]|uniref:Uncharacterized protein n=1 Tax=Candidatus Methanoperedens nitratireducens TaxID=1392998 RepID=A0A062V227_9EURY|nr:hypothetical protein [Candidatus Methanoperedens nitroreducens]KCZ73161.1 hypothetical protein ANME2D_00220 [Candidatus Methanoperedens nitroreducens]MDJ1422890.1 hypothetical protein [Candidatus Methanoperedens sp.]
MVQVVDGVLTGEFIGNLANILIRIVAAIIILLIAWLLGRALGKIVSGILDRVGLDDALRRTSLGKTIEASGISIVFLFDVIVRWFIYLIGIMAAVDVLRIEMLSDFMRSVVLYLPSLAAGIAILVVGFILADFIGDLMRRTGEASDVAYIGVFSAAVKIFLYFVVVILALDQLRIDTSIIYVFATALAWGIAIAIAIGVGVGLGFALRDRMPRWLDTLEHKEKRSAEKLEKETK